MAEPRSPEPLILALDFPTREASEALVEQLDPGDCRLKIGKELFTRAGPAYVETLVGRGFDIFLDLKFHDIPNTVASAVAAAADLGVWMVNVHASGGSRMMEAAAERLAGKPDAPLLIGVTVLTSMGTDDLKELGIDVPAEEQVMRLARLAAASGLDGLVCSAAEARGLRAEFGPQLQLVTPGIRLADSAADDQQRVMTPVEALRAGATHLVVGRPVTRAADPLAALHNIRREIEENFR